MRPSGFFTRARILGTAIAGAAALVSSCGGSATPPFGTLVYTTPNPLPAAWTPTTAAPTRIPGWDLYRGAEVEMWLPEGFVGGDPVARREELLGIARTAGTAYEGVVRALEEQPENLLFYSWELPQYQMIVGVTRHDAPAEVSVEIYLEQWADAVLGQFPALDEISKGPVMIAGETVGRAVMDLTQPGAVTRQISYLFKEGGTVWVLGYGFPAERYTELVPMVELSVQTFRRGP
jgi:hypothetical protein